jgi:hypothetical protein
MGSASSTDITLKPDLCPMPTRLSMNVNLARLRPPWDGIGVAAEMSQYIRRLREMRQTRRGIYIACASRSKENHLQSALSSLVN